MSEIEEVINTESATDFAIQLGSIGKWLQAIGIIVVAWLIFQIINWFINQRRLSKLNKIDERLSSLEEKTDKILKLIKKKS